ncbi:MAG: hypothetical protein CVU05_00045 [Bacteroidetes bacterium HGW-Bacteroidetes-21]|jgi:hypothetical protein|nr:MAG: hypothetical protein CVU05_00045 [Bacteroidetes bacterium HGW-Bacteroidetes-21]
MNKVQLSVLGLSLSESTSNAYALILSDETSQKRIPIIIGSAEAQAIAIELESLKPPRPLTHDLLKNITLSFDIHLTEVNIYKLEEGIFFSNLVFENGSKKMVIDSRTSDAVALALRFKCPIFTTRDIVEKAGVFLKFDSKKEDPDAIEDFNPDADEDDFEKDSPIVSVQSKTIAELETMLQQAIQNEEYELASRVKEELNRRNKDNL